MNLTWVRRTYPDCQPDYADTASHFEIDHCLNAEPSAWRLQPMVSGSFSFHRTLAAAKAEASKQYAGHICQTCRHDRDHHVGVRQNGRTFPTACGNADCVCSSFCEVGE